MEATSIIRALDQMRSQLQQPANTMQMIRQSVLAQANRLSIPQMPELLTEDQRRVFLADINRLEAFLKSEDGADAIALLVRSFEEFTEAPPEPTPVEAEHADHQ